MVTLILYRWFNLSKVDHMNSAHHVVAIKWYGWLNTMKHASLYGVGNHYHMVQGNKIAIMSASMVQSHHREIMSLLPYLSSVTASLSKHNTNNSSKVKFKDVVQTHKNMQLPPLNAKKQEQLWQQWQQEMSQPQGKVFLSNATDNGTSSLVDWCVSKNTKILQTHWKEQI